jgi:hypothetical protein
MRRFGRSLPASRPVEAVILFWVGLHRLAISASELREIRNDRGLAPAEFGCAAIVPASALFGGAPPQGGRLLVLRHSGVAVSVDGVDRLIEITAVYVLPRAFRGAERCWYRGLVLLGDAVIPLVNPEVFVVHAELAEPQVVPAASGCAVQGWAQEANPV